MELVVLRVATNGDVDTENGTCINKKGGCTHGGCGGFLTPHEDPASAERVSAIYARARNPLGLRAMFCSKNLYFFSYFLISLRASRKYSAPS